MRAVCAAHGNAQVKVTWSEDILICNTEWNLLLILTCCFTFYFIQSIFNKTDIASTVRQGIALEQESASAKGKAPSRLAKIC